MLVVDDVEDITATYEMLLNALGYETRTAASAKQAIAAFEAFRPDFALLDIGMPDMDGYELCRRLRTLPGTDDCLLYSQSGWGNDQDFERSAAAGSTDHLVKPLDADSLQRCLVKPLA